MTPIRIPASGTNFPISEKCVRCGAEIQTDGQPCNYPKWWYDGCQANLKQPQINQCDGCRVGWPLGGVNNRTHYRNGHPEMICQKYKYV